MTTRHVNYQTEHIGVNVGRYSRLTRDEAFEVDHISSQICTAVICHLEDSKEYTKQWTRLRAPSTRMGM